MRFRQRLAAWAVTGFLQQAILIGLGAAGALILVAVVTLLFGSLVVRAVLPAVERRIDAGWADVLGPLSTLPERYPPMETNARARFLEATAATLGIALAAENDPSGDRPTASQQAAFEELRESLISMAGSSRSRLAAARTIGPWLYQSRHTIDQLVETLSGEEQPVWTMNLDHCSGAVHADLEGLVDLHRVLTAAAGRELEIGDSAAAGRILEASWRLNQGLLRSPHLAEHVAAITVTDLQMAVLRELEAPGSHWRVRLAALDLERHALEAYRFDAWRLRCQTNSFLSDFNPLIGMIAHPFARVLAIPQHQAMVWAVEELPQRDPESFDPDTFAAEQHRRVPRWNPVARAALRRDWTSWPRSLRAALNVELTLRVLELKASILGSGRFDIRDIRPRQPSRVSGLDWRYEVVDDRIHIFLDDGDRLTKGHPPLGAWVPLDQPTVNGGRP